MTDFVNVLPAAFEAADKISKVITSYKGPERPKFAGQVLGLVLAPMISSFTEEQRKELLTTITLTFAASSNGFGDGTYLTMELIPKEKL